MGAVGLTQMAIWIAFFVLLEWFVAWRVTLGSAGLAAFGVTPLQLIFFVLYFLLGFFFYSALRPASAPPSARSQEVQQFSMIIVVPLTVGLVLIVYILSNPSALAGGVVVAVSAVHADRDVPAHGLAMPPAWQLALSLVLMVVSISAWLWVASRIYRVGILMYGKRPTLPEMLRWIRYS